MLHSLRRGTAVVSFVCGTGTMLLGCGHRMGPVQATQSDGWVGHPNLPDIFVEKAKDCVAQDAWQMDPGRVVLRSTLEVNEDSDKVGVTIADIPDKAPDFGACMRNVLRDMPIAEAPFQQGVGTLKYLREHAGDGDDALRRFIEVIPGVPIVESELVLEAEGYTVVLPVTVKVVDKQVKQIDLDKAILTKIGQMALNSVGYEEIMLRAEQLGWVKTVRDEQALSAADKRFIAQELSPVPLPPPRLPPPPPPSVIVKTVFKRVITRTAPVAVGISLADTPAPGIADIVALGFFAVAMLAAGGMTVYEIVTTPSTATTTTPAPPIPATTPTATPVAAPRKYPNQTCENDEMARLEKEMHEIFCDKGYAATCGGGGISKKKLPFIPCSAVRLSLQQRQACLAARWKVQNECFGGKPDTEHKDEIDNVQRGVDYCKALEPINCAKGHPMANL